MRIIGFLVSLQRAAPLRCALSVLAVLLYLGVTQGAGWPRPPTEGAVYSVSALHAHLAHDPHAWLGRTVRLRALVPGGCHTDVPRPDSIHCDSGRPVLLMDPQALDTGQPLPLLASAPDPFLAALRHLPPVGTLVPPPQPVQWGTVAVYRVRLAAIAPRMRGAPPGYVALLVDAAPGALDEG